MMIEMMNTKKPLLNNIQPNIFEAHIRKEIKQEQLNKSNTSN